MNEIKIGEYVRANEGIIGKIKRIELDKNDTSLKWYVFDKKRPDMNIINEVYINKPYIVNHSKDIIDLIEVGDIIEIQTGLYNKYKIIIEDEDKLILIKESLQNWTIKSIVTHEQFENIEYKVGD